MASNKYKPAVDRLRLLVEYPSGRAQSEIREAVERSDVGDVLRAVARKLERDA